MKKEKKSTLIDEKEIEQLDSPDYSKEELTYLKNLREKIVKARDKREQSFKEFDGMSFTQYWLKCEELANNTIPPKKYKNDITYKSGFLRQKLFAILSNIMGLNLEPQISSYNKDNVPINSLGNAMEIILWKTNELDNDEEKKMLRFYELIVRGFVFVEEIWEDKYRIEKKSENPGGKFRGVKIEAKKVKCFSKATRNIIPSTSVFLGDLTKPNIADQPYIYTATKMRYDEAEKIYGEYEMWKYVSKKVRPFEQSVEGTIDSSNLWFFEESQEDYVEIIKYQDKPNNEFQVIINGIPMFPVGFSFPWKYNEYNIVQQNLRPIRHNFAYGKSFLFENKNVIELIDSFTRYNVLKTLKSLYPPYLNISTKIIGNEVLQPGKISVGIPPGALQPISQKESEGVTQSEYMMLENLIRNLDQNTVSQTFSGQQERKTGVTATQILEIQKQSKIMLGVLITCAALLEQKLATIRLFNVIQNWFEEDGVLDAVKGEIKSKYKGVAKKGIIPGEGEGTMYVVPSKDKLTPEQIRMEEDMETIRTGKPVRIMLLNPDEIKSTKLIWVVAVHPREQKTSELNKIMFSQMLQEAIGIGLQLNMKHVAERFAEVWEEDPSKLFTDTPEQPVEQMEDQGQVGGVPNPAAMDNIEPRGVSSKPLEIKPQIE
jgi:hypothetical protein